QTASTLQKNKSNTLNASAINKRTKISNEVLILTIENIIDSIILTPSSKADISSSEHQTSPLIQQQEYTNTSTMKINPTALTELLNITTNTSMHANQKSSTLLQQNNNILQIMTKESKKKCLWQIAFIVYESADAIKEFYDNKWSTSLLDFLVRVEPTDLNELQNALRQ
ncbi:10659_t:CDS:2, partial [Funneliformis geosporum]